MPITRRSLPELNSSAQADIATRIAGATPQLRRSLLGALASVIAGGFNALYGYLFERTKQNHPYTATGVWLERWAKLWNIPRKQPTAAVGPALATGASGVTIPAGTRLQAPGGAVYAVDAVATTVSGSVSIALTAIAAGAAGNQAADTVLSWVNTPSGLDSTVIVGDGGLGGGADLESDDALRARMIQRIQAPGHGGNEADYLGWAKSIASITRAWVFPLYDGPGSVRVYVANDAYVGANLASPSDVSAVQSYIDSVRPVTVVKETSPGSGVFVPGFEAVAPIATAVPYTIAIVPDNADNRAAVDAALEELYYREAEPEGGISLNKMVVAIGSSGISDFTMTAPAVAPTATAGHILVKGPTTWA